MQKWIVLSVLSGVALFAVGAVAEWPMVSRVTQDNHDQIQQGMDRAEVQNLLGAPGDYRTAPTYSDTVFGDRFYYNFTPDPAIFPDGADDPHMESRESGKAIPETLTYGSTVVASWVSISFPK